VPILHRGHPEPLDAPLRRRLGDLVGVVDRAHFPGDLGPTGIRLLDVAADLVHPLFDVGQGEDPEGSYRCFMNQASLSYIS